ncbi:MAG: hypothetical protein HQL32_03285 [Planctomycetes bacterium]|nr:hypothetical protein [Planctomycetota bacterium]
MKIIVSLLVLLIGLGFCVDEARKEYVSNEPSRWLPGFPIASTGPLKGVLVSAWWMKIHRLRHQFKFDEIGVMTKRIALLQPNIPEVWEYLSWNMSFNLLADNRGNRQAQERWLKEGLLCLEKGLNYIPDNSLLLYSQAYTVHMKRTSTPSFEEELRSILQEDPIKYAFRKVAESQVHLKGTYVQLLFYIKISLDAGELKMAQEGVEQLRIRFPDRMPVLEDFE